jgi:hypothetical protein
MDHDAAFHADDRVDNLHQRALPRDRTGKNTMIAARGGIDSDATVTIDENAPLLDQSSNQGSLGQDSIDDAGQWVDEFSEWETLPWYQRPSVNVPYRTFHSCVNHDNSHTGF